VGSAELALESKGKNNCIPLCNYVGAALLSGQTSGNRPPDLKMQFDTVCRWRRTKLLSQGAFDVAGGCLHFSQSAITEDGLNAVGSRHSSLLTLCCLAGPKTI